MIGRVCRNGDVPVVDRCERRTEPKGFEGLAGPSGRATCSAKEVGYVDGPDHFTASIFAMRALSFSTCASSLGADAMRRAFSLASSEETRDDG
jgi:hypothetical protein